MDIVAGSKHANAVQHGSFDSCHRPASSLRRKWQEQFLSTLSVVVLEPTLVVCELAIHTHEEAIFVVHCDCGWEYITVTWATFRDFT